MSERKFITISSKQFNEIVDYINLLKEYNSKLVSKNEEYNESINLLRTTISKISGDLVSTKIDHVNSVNTMKSLSDKIILLENKKTIIKESKIISLLKSLVTDNVKPNHKMVNSSSDKYFNSFYA